ncbi:hypothetical protein AA106_07945 [Photorhabdus laumondii subsp. laumondii]|nr:hypothetical protein AA106_07945 [Photorhabdus laumondii subsp. laumondii]
MKHLTLSLCLMAALFVAIIQGVGMVRPDSVPAASVEEPGYQNVQHALRVIAAEPHPTAAPRQAFVRRYLLSEISTMGYRAIEQPFLFTIAEIVSHQEKIYSQLNSHQRLAFDAELARVGAHNFEEEVRIRSGLKQGDSAYGTNIIARLDSPSAKGTLLIMAHYDSVGTAPGAGDDGMAVASILQLMRDVAGRADLKNNIIFLLTDGEELGLFGAHYFIKMLNETELQSINLALNFEARGNDGIPLLFETSEKNFDLISKVSKAPKKIIAFSFTPLIYRMMQNDTDFTVFKNKGLAGLNFAVVQGFEHYHRMNDSVENIPLATLFEYQKTVREIGRYFAEDVDIVTLGQQTRAVYFPVPGWGLVIMPLFLAFTLGGGVFILCLLWIKNGADHRPILMFIPFLRSTAIFLLGLFSMTLAIKLPEISYLLTLPLLFFLLSHIILVKYHNYFISLAIAVLGVYISGILYVPVVFLIARGLQALWLSVIIALIPIVIWMGKSIDLWREANKKV